MYNTILGHNDKGGKGKRSFYDLSGPKCWLRTTGHLFFEVFWARNIFSRLPARSARIPSLDEKTGLVPNQHGFHHGARFHFLDGNVEIAIIVLLDKVNDWESTL